MPDTDLPSTAPAVSVSGERFVAVQASPEFQELRDRLRRFVFPMTAVFLLWYFAYVLLGAFAHDFMATRVWGDINVGVLIGLGQFVTTFLITRSMSGSPTVSSTRAPKPSATSSEGGAA